MICNANSSIVFFIKPFSAEVAGSHQISGCAMPYYKTSEKTKNGTTKTKS